MRILHYILIIAGAMSLAACSGDDFSDSEAQELSGSSLSKMDIAQLHARLKDQYISELQRTYGVGYGYDATGQFANYNDVRDRIVEIDKLEKYDNEHNTQTITDDHVPQSFQHVVEGKDSEAFLKAMSANAGISADLGFFQGEAEVSYHSSDMGSSEFSFCTIQDGITLVSRHLEPKDLAVIAKRDTSVLSPGFRQYIDSIAYYQRIGNNYRSKRLLKEMFETYGTHFIYHADLGGMLNFTSTVERRSLDSKKGLSESAKADFMGMCGMETSSSEESSFVQNSVKNKCRITARGGEVSQLTDMLMINNDTTSMALRRKLCDDWYKSVKISFSDPNENNVELVGMKLIRVEDLIYNDKVLMEYHDMVDSAQQVDNEPFPRVYNSCYTRLPITYLDIKSETKQYTVSSNNEIIGEISTEYVDHHKYIVFYPILSGEVQHEGIGRDIDNDSIAVITWNNRSDHPELSKCTVTRVGTRSTVPYLYYNDGDVSIAPDEDKVYSEESSYDDWTFPMWTDNNNSVFRCGPYVLVTGSYATTGTNSLNNYAAVSKDIPSGYKVMENTEISTMLYFIKNKHLASSKEQPLFFTSNKKWLLLKDTKTTSAHFYVDEDSGLKLNYDDNDWGFLICRRLSDFRYP